ncbi:MAG: hypothetical protein LWW85_04325 [Marinilabiliales bacterium]|nr:hypothetical protein [Marinilabiliales bacterium]
MAHFLKSGPEGKLQQNPFQSGNDHAKKEQQLPKMPSGQLERTTIVLPLLLTYLLKSDKKSMFNLQIEIKKGQKT